MSVMHPHRRAQLEAGQAQQAANDASGKTARDKLAAAAKFAQAAPLSATGANCEPAGFVQHGPQPVIDAKRIKKTQKMNKTKKIDNPEFAKKVAANGTLSNAAQTSQKRALRRKGKDLRRQINEADQAGDYALAQQIFDELASVRVDGAAVRAAILRDPEEIARRAHKKAAKNERKATEKANGTFSTAEEKRAKRFIEDEARAKSDPAWAARQLQRMDISKAKKVENLATKAAVARYQEGNTMRDASFQPRQPIHDTFHEGHVVQHAANNGQQFAEYTNDREEQADMYGACHSPSPHQNLDRSRGQLDTQHEDFYREQLPSRYDRYEQRTQYEYSGQRPAGYDQYQKPQPVEYGYFQPQPPGRHDYFGQWQQLVGHDAHQVGPTNVQKRALPVEHSFEQQGFGLTGVRASYKRQKRESRTEAAERKNRSGTAATRSTVHALGLGLERMEMDAESSDGVSSDDEVESRWEDPSYSAPQLTTTGREERNPLSLHCKPKPQAEAFERERQAINNSSLQENDICPGDLAIAAPRSVSPERQATRFIHGDGSKAFLDPNSTAYKMMSRMGWAQGRGLGKDGAGPQDFIKVNWKKDRKGVQETGATAPAHTGGEIHAALTSPTKLKSPPRPISLAGFAPWASNATGHTGLAPATLPKSSPEPSAFAGFAQRTSNQVDLTSDDGDHPQVTSHKRMIIDLTQDDTDSHLNGNSNDQPAFIDLTRDDDKSNARKNVTRILMDVRSPLRDMQEQHAVVGTAQQASTSAPSILASIAQETRELHSVAVGNEQVYFVQDTTGDASLNQAG